jgi:hypothetical protein
MVDGAEDAAIAGAGIRRCHRECFGACDTAGPTRALLYLEQWQ